jgi:hypothetical protein
MTVNDIITILGYGLGYIVIALAGVAGYVTAVVPMFN